MVGDLDFVEGGVRGVMGGLFLVGGGGVAEGLVEEDHFGEGGDEHVLERAGGVGFVGRRVDFEEHEASVVREAVGG